jgi:hypothetical protein
MLFRTHVIALVTEPPRVGPHVGGHGSLPMMELLWCGRWWATTVPYPTCPTLGFMGAFAAGSKPRGGPFFSPYSSYMFPDTHPRGL